MGTIKTKKEAIRNGDKTYIGHACERGHTRRVLPEGECYYCEHSKKVIKTQKVKKLPHQVDELIEKHKNNIMYTQWRKTA